MTPTPILRQSNVRLATTIVPNGYRVSTARIALPLIGQTPVKKELSYDRYHQQPAA